MPSSISSSERLTASDRPGVAQPVPMRDIPAQPWRRIFIVMILLFTVLIAGWEWHWRDFGAIPSYRNTDSLWAIQRLRIDQGEGDATVVIGSSRLLFDLQLDEWQKLSGRRPIQLAFEGTSSVPFLQDLAADAQFKGRLLVGVTPDFFFTGVARHAGVLKNYRKESPSQKSGQWLSMHLIEPWLAFYDPDFALATVIKRQSWPERPGGRWFTDVRKLFVSEADRNSHLWQKVEKDTDYRDLARAIWAQRFVPSQADPPPEKVQKVIDEQIDLAVAAAATLRARGVQVVFVRAPSDGAYLEFEKRQFPREKTWDVLIARSGVAGIHFEDHAELQGMNIPDGSHLSAADAGRFTQALYHIIERDFPQFDPAR